MDLISDSHVPKYAQIADIFRQRISRGIWAQGLRAVIYLGEVTYRGDFIRIDMDLRP